MFSISPILSEKSASAKKKSKESSNLSKFHLTEINTNDLCFLHIYFFLIFCF